MRGEGTKIDRWFIVLHKCFFGTVASGNLKSLQDACSYYA
uniref:Uncharacterized protein n=1 Tax=Arundo donax TaxID=35708 RepID=A0A0A9BPC1_ARUDO